MTWAIKECPQCFGRGYEPAGETELAPCPRCFNSGKVMREGAKERYLLHVAFQLCEQGLAAREINFTRIEQMWNEGAEPKTAISHFLLEAARPIGDNQGAMDGSSPTPTSGPK